MTRDSSDNGMLFDEYGPDYDAALAHGLAVSGEDKNYFAQGRIAWMANCLRQLEEQPRSIMDFGCGTGSATPFLLDLLGVESLCGVDIAAKSLDVAKRAYNSERTQFLLIGHYQPSERIDLVFCNGVFHHIPVHQRLTAINYVYDSLRPGGCSHCGKTTHGTRVPVT